MFKTVTKTLIPLLLVAVFLYPFSLNAQTELQWGYYAIGQPSVLTFNLTETYLQITASLTSNTQGFTIGSLYYIFPRAPIHTSPWYVDYSVPSFAGTGNCTMRPVIQGSNVLTGANTITISSTLTATTSRLTFTSPSTNNGQPGVGIVRSSGTCALTMLITEIRASDNLTVLWSPATSNPNSEIIFPDNIEFQSDTIVWSMGFMIFLMAINTWYVIIRKR